MANPIPVGSQFAINTTLIGDQNAASVIGLANGRFVATWTDASVSLGDVSGLAVRGQVFNANGSKFGAEFLVPTATASDQTEPTLTAFADGRFVAFCTDNSQTGGDTAYEAVRGQVFNPDGTKSGADFNVNAQLVHNQTLSSLTG